MEVVDDPVDDPVEAFNLADLDLDDIDGDGEVGIGDLLALLAAWGATGP